MITELKLQEHNKIVYEELLRDLVHRTEIVTFTLVINGGQIVDYTIVESITPESPLDTLVAYEPRPAQVSGETGTTVSEG